MKNSAKISKEKSSTILYKCGREKIEEKYLAEYLGKIGKEKTVKSSAHMYWFRLGRGNRTS